MKINKVYQKVRKSALKWNNPGKTSLPNGKSLPEDWSPGSNRSVSTEFTPSMDFSASTEINGDDLPAMPLDVEDSEGRYYRGSPRVVFFDEEVLVRRVRPVYKIGGQIDRRLLWYQEDEYKEIMWKARRLVKRAINDEENTNNNEKYCLRGLEHVTNSVTRRTKANLDGREAVLDEQCLQFQNEVFPLDDNKIASVYVPFTKSHRDEAIERAQMDAEEAELYQRTSSSTSTSSSQRASRSSNSLRSSHSSLQAPKTPRTSLTSQSSFKSQSSPASPSLVNKPGMMFTNIKTTQYPAALKLENI